MLAVSAYSTAAIAQSFDYPAGSPALFSRGSENANFNNSLHSAPNAPPVVPTTVPPVATVPQAVSKPSLFSRLFSRSNKTAQPSFSSSSLYPVPATRAPRSPIRPPVLPRNASHQANRPNPQAYDTQNVVYIHRPQDLASTPQKRTHAETTGYQPQNQPTDIGPAPFEQQRNKTPYSILEKSNATATPASTRLAMVTTASPPSIDLSAPSKADFDPPQPSAAIEIQPQPAPAKATRVALPKNAFKQEFERAYRYINSPPASQTPPATRVAESEKHPDGLKFGDFFTPTPRQTVQGDFSLEDTRPIKTPEFISPRTFEQSPNAAAPDFIPQRIDTLPSKPTKQPSVQAPWNDAESANANPPTPLESIPRPPSNHGFSDDFGSLDDWQPPQTSQPQKSLKSLEEELETLSQTFNAEFDANSITTGLVSKEESPTWWKTQVIQPLHPENHTLTINSNGLVFAALQNSPRIQAVSKTPLIRELQVVEADAEFDPVRFVRSQFQDRVDPVGSSLTIGQGSTEQFLRDNIWTAEGGIRRKLRTGADLTVSQQLGFQNSNSNNFTPQDQGTATLALNVTQPLLRGRGRVFNQAQILIAQSTGAVAWEEFQQELQEELEGVVSAYWQLYLNRSIYLQRKRNVQRGQAILDRLNGRRALDSLPAQIARAKSSVQTRKTELANAFRNIRNAETEIRRRIADRNWMASQSLELLPEELPTVEDVGWSIDQVVQTALNHRPEIRESVRRIKIAGIQRDVSQHELLPELSFLFGTYVSALQGESDVLGAFTDQFGEVTPGYSFGLEYELPKRNRAARSRFQQRHLQFKRLQNELEEVIQNVIAESQIALRRIDSAVQTLSAAEEAIVAARADLNQNQTRWESFALVEGDIADGATPTTILDQLLDSQERLSQTEIVYAQAELELKIAEVALQRSMGTLLMRQQVTFDRQIISDTPAIRLQTQTVTTPAHQRIPVQNQFQ